MNEIFQKAYDDVASSSLETLRNSIYQKALRYCIIRNEWILMEPSDRLENDLERTILHNSFIDALNIMSRNMSQNGEDNKWRMLLGNDRKILGDFACFIVYMNGVKAR